MTFIDTGPLVALHDRRQPKHAEVRDRVRELAPKLVTTWPCLTEAMYLLGKLGGWPYQRNLWTSLESGITSIHLPNDFEILRQRAMMEQFKDLPMDLADASIVSAAEALNVTRIFSFDRHFFAYRLSDGRSFEVISATM